MNKKIAIMLAGILAVSLISAGCSAPSVEEVESAPAPEAPPVEETVDVPVPEGEEETDVPVSEVKEEADVPTPEVEEPETSEDGQEPAVDEAEETAGDAGEPTGEIIPFTEEELAALPPEMRAEFEYIIDKLEKGEPVVFPEDEVVPETPVEEPVEMPVEKTDAEVQQTLNEICDYIKNNIDTTGMSESGIAHIDDNIEYVRDSMNHDEFTTWISGYKCGSWTREELEYSFKAWVEGGGNYSEKEFYAW